MKHERISIDPAVMVGKPCIKGTRIPVEHILRELAGGMTIEAIMDAHPHLKPEDINASIEYAADVIHQVWLTTQPTLLGEQRDEVSG